MKIGDARRDEGGRIAVVMATMWPSASLVLAVMLAASPGAGSGIAVTQLLPVAVIFFWSIRRKRDLPALVVFACGLMLDVLSFGPAGYWALVYLVTGKMAATVGEFANGGIVARTAMLAACLALACGVQVAVLAAFGVELAELAEMGAAGVVIMVAYPLIARLLSVGAGRRGTGSGLRFAPQGRS